MTIIITQETVNRLEGFFARNVRPVSFDALESLSKDVSDDMADVLEKTYQGLIKERSADAARNFAFLVVNTPILSMHDLMSQMPQFAQNNFKITPFDKKPAQFVLPFAIASNPREAREISKAYAGRAKTQQLKSKFIQDHWAEFSDTQRRALSNLSPAAQVTTPSRAGASTRIQ